MAKAKSRPRSRVKKCLTPGCNATNISSRGLCGTCYQTALAYIKDGLTTWNELEHLGLAIAKVQSSTELTGSAIFKQSFINAKIQRALEE